MAASPSPPNPPPASNRQRWPAKIALLVASVALVLLMAEVALRLVPRETPLPRPPNVGTRALLAKEPSLPVYRSVMELGAPNLRGIFRGHIHRTNRHGIRGPDYAPRPAPNVFRIVIVGDSVTAGSGVAEASAYPAQLEGLLNASSRERRFEVINAGLGGINARMVVDRLARVMKLYRPDLVVYGFTINDIEGEHYVRFKKKEGEKGFFSQIRRFDHSSSELLATLWPKLMSLLDRVSASSYSNEIRFNYFENPEAWRELDAQLARFAGITQRRGVCGVALIHTQLAQLGYFHPFESSYERVEDALAARGVTVIQTLPAHRGIYGLDYWVAPADPHPNHAGHEILARALLEGLQGLPAKCWRTRGQDFRPGVD